MDFRSKLEELQLTTDEITRFSKALKDDKFREMLHEYAEEISKPENKKKYEDEITQLEQEMGMNIKFVHPKPHHVLKTSLNGKEKCFINICSNVLIDKPVCKAGRGQGGRVGQHWSLPYSLAPGRLDRDSKGNKCTIYDVVFHPDTLYIAGNDSRLMKLVNSTATQGVEDAFKVTLDQINAKILKIQYKGVPHPAVIRKPIPGKEKASPFSEFRPSCPDTAPNQKAKTAAAVPSQNFRIPGKESASEQPVKPHYTIKYRSVVDLQDYRCSRDSAPSPHPKEIVITVDLPLIKSARDIDLNVTKRNLVLESQKPEYKLELQLSYPVDDYKGDAKFYKAKKQLTISLPVLPAKQIVSHEGENADQVQALVCEGKEVDKNEHRDMNLSNFSYNAQCVSGTSVQDPESVLQFCSDRVESKAESLESHCDAAKDVAAQLTCEGPNTETSNLEKNETDKPEDYSLSGPDFFTSKMPSKHHTKVETYSCNLREECLLTPAEIADISQHKPTVAHPPMICAVSDCFCNTEKTFLDIPNDPTSLSQQPIGKSVVELSVVSNSLSKMNFTLDEDTIKAVSFPEDTEGLPEEQVVNSSPEQIGPALGHKDIKFSSLIQETEVQLKEKVDCVHSLEQCQTDRTLKTSVILREKNPNGSDVIIRNRGISAALSFQNSLWFELD